MQTVRQTIKPVSFILATLMLIISGPCQSALAVMVGTESVMQTPQSREARARIHQVLQRQDVRQELIRQGIDLNEVEARVNSLSDAEAMAVADQLDHLPAGGGALEVLLVVSLIVFIILLITDIMGYTDIFPFVK